MENNLSKIKKLTELERYINVGLCNGLSHTHMDSRRDDITFWRKRSMLFNAFTLCVKRIIDEQDYSMEEKELKTLASEGYTIIE